MVWQWIQKGIWLFVAGLWLLAPAGIWAQSGGVAENGDTYAESLVEKAVAMRLYEDRYWKILYHYHDTPFGRTVSRIDDPDYFLSPDGKKDPKAEMTAFVLRFFGEKAPEDICPYSARYHWLAEALSVDTARVPERRCASIERVKADAATLVFPSYYMNSPASMFGHTLLTLKTGNESRMLDKAVNYSAFTNESNGFAFAFKGIFGLYDGFFSVLEYYKKIQEYGEMNQRDIWEYRLNLTPAELDRMVRHIRDLEDISSDYYFFDENCSYNLLYLMEAARPTLRLTEKNGLWVIPVETVRLLREKGVITETTYQPSRATILRHRLQALSETDQDLAFGILEGTVGPETVLDLPPDRAVAVMDTVVDCIRYEFVKKHKDLTKYRKTLMQALRVRSKLPKGLSDFRVASPEPPENVHAPGRFVFGAASVDGRGAMTVGWRPSYTDLTDPDSMDSDGVQIRFGDARFRIGPEGEGANLSSFEVVDLVSLSPRDRFFQPMSWAVNAGLEGIPGEDRGRLGRISGGAGFAWGGQEAGITYLMLRPGVFAGSGLEDGWSMGAVLRAGWVGRIGKNSKWQVYGDAGGYGIGHDGPASGIGLEGAFRLRQNLHLGFSASHEDRFGNSESKAMVECRIFR